MRRALLCSRVVVPTASLAMANVFPVVAINETDYNGPGADNSASIELVGTAGTDMSGWTIKLINQDGSEYGSFALSGTIPSGFHSAWPCPVAPSQPGRESPLGGVAF